MKFLPWLIAIVATAVAGYLYGTRVTSPTPTTSLEMVVAQSLPAVVSVRTDIANLADPEMRGVGSAFHIGDGYYVTAAHVVDGGSKLYLDNRRRTANQLENTTPAVLVGKVDELDLALLRGQVIAAKLDWADAPSPIGAICFAIGNPFARAQRSVTVGVISGLQRLQTTPKGALAGLLQFDAPVNPGNSGGALLNASGQVLGVVSSILSGNGSSAGVGFAIPSQSVRPVVEALRHGEKPKLRRLGISSQTDSAVVQTVLPGSLAANSGVQEGDTLLEVAGLAVDTVAEADAVVLAANLGEKLEVLLKRRGKVMKLNLEVR